MDRRKYLTSFGLFCSGGYIMYNNNIIQPTLATNINLSDEKINIPKDITDKSDPKLRVNFDNFKIREKNYYGGNPNYIIEAQTIYNGNESGFKKLQEESFELDTENNIKNISNPYFISLELPDSLEEDENFTITIEFKIDTTDDTIRSSVIKSEDISFNVKSMFESLSHHFIKEESDTYASSTSASEIQIRDTKEITEYEPQSGEYTIETEFIENGSYAGDESADYELGIQLLDENDSVVNTISNQWTVTNTDHRTGSATGEFEVGENYSWRYFIGSNGATVTSWSPNNPDNEGYIDIYSN